MNQPNFLNSQLDQFSERWELIDNFQETCAITEVDFRLAGFAARRVHDQVVVTGSACAQGQDPRDRAWFELLERMSLVTARSLPADTRWCLRKINTLAATRLATSRELFVGSPEPELWIPAKSNGVAMGPTWKAAGQHALCELIERHMVLASWYGAITPHALPAIWPLHLGPLQQAFCLEHYGMGEFTCDSSTIHTRATFLWSLEGKPVIYGFGAHSNPDLALERSFNEALQRLCFLQDAESSEEELVFRPAPDFHQEFFLQPQQQTAIKGWLAGEHFQARYADVIPFSGTASWLDLTPHDLFPGKVVQVFMPDCLPLIFGRYQPPQFPDLHPDRWIHPIV